MQQLFLFETVVKNSIKYKIFKNTQKKAGTLEGLPAFLHRKNSKTV